MKYKERHTEEIKECNSGFQVYDGNNNEYTITINSLGELEITANDGSLRIEPRYSNQIILHTKE